jgi:hypothetical protein
MRLAALSCRSVDHATRPWSTTRLLAQRRERPGCNPVFQNIGVVSAEQDQLVRIVPEPWTDSKPGPMVCALRCLRSVVASVNRVGVGDGTHANHSSGSPCVSRTAIAAALALEDVAGGERLVAFALASFANREQLAWPGTPAASARAGLARSRYLDARNRLLTRGLIETDETGGGRGRSTTVLLRFADGARFDGPINAELFETMLSYSRCSGPARLLLASIAALADEHGQLDGVTADTLCAVAGLAERTYRRARNALIASGELELMRGVGGRGHSNGWRVSDPRANEPAGANRPRRRPPSGANRPLMAPAARPASEPAASAGVTGVANASTASMDDRTTTVKGGQHGTVSGVKGGQDRTVSAVKGGQDGTVSAVKGGQDGTVSGVKGGQDRTVSAVKGGQGRTVSGERGPERGPPNARAWKEPRNQGTSEHPPNPPEGGLGTGELSIEESYVTERGRRRKRLVRVDVDAVSRELTPPGAAEREIWLNARTLMRDAIGESTFEIWLSAVELVAVGREQALVLTAPEATLDWVQKRFGRLLSRCCEQSGRRFRFASPLERAAIQHTSETGSRAVVREQSTMNRRVS